MSPLKLSTRRIHLFQYNLLFNTIRGQYWFAYLVHSIAIALAIWLDNIFRDHDLLAIVDAVLSVHDVLR
jgi:hypothetical protein